METTDYIHELTTVDSERLSEAAGRLDNFGVEKASEKRYAFYRRRGYSRNDALGYALAWCRNAREQAERRLSHETGAENWRPLY